ncbi:mycothione reductase, partial [Mycobacterium sp. ITM-2017-0098]
GSDLVEITGTPGDLVIHLGDGSTVRADTLLVAAGRIPNGDRLEVAEGGIDTHDDGRIVVDQYCRTTSDGVFAIGDVSTPIPL